jgi:hypothetical protein
MRVVLGCGTSGADRTLLARYALLNRRNNLVFSRESMWRLLGCQGLTHPHREFAAPALNQLRFEAGFVLDARRRTGGSGVIVSNLAVTNANAGHRPSPRGLVNL